MRADIDVIGIARATPDDFLEACGPTLVIAPHPDDESIGCGGLIARLRAAEVPVHVVLMSDGAMSHPHSELFDAAARRSLREAEMRHALELLGVARGHLRTLGLPDGDVPARSSAASESAGSGPCDFRFTQAVTDLHALIFELAPTTIVMPWRRDPHPDHRACWSIATAACLELEAVPRTLEYLVWTMERGDDSARPRPDEMQAWRLDISAVVEAKRAAIEAHRSQLGQVIPDDPTGFVLPPEMVTRACAPFEIYLEPIDASQTMQTSQTQLAAHGNVDVDVDEGALDRAAV
ncbi:MAG: family deacetylase [Rhizobacter sp.]|nr:family deacetylase [Rhizobacter sp.]